MAELVSAPSPMAAASQHASATSSKDQDHQSHRSIVATRVPDHQRLAFLPRVFGPKHYRRGECAVFDWMARLCPDYRGGFWHFYDLSNGGFYLALDEGSLKGPNGARQMHLVWEDNAFEGTMSAAAAGVVASLFAINHLIWGGCGELEDAYYALRDYAAEHPEGRQILRAID